MKKTKTIENITTDFDYVKFDPIPHTYTNTENGLEYTSVTRVLGKYKNPFDSDTISKRVAERDNMPQALIRQLWDIKRDYASLSGTEFHLYVEEFLLNNRRIPSVTKINDKISQFHEFWDHYSKTLEVVGCEILLVDDDSMLAGTIDCLVKNKETGMYRIIDWKTNEKITKASYNKKLNGVLSGVEDSKFNAYGLQLAMYKRMLEKHYPDIKVESGVVVHFAPDSNYRVMFVPSFDEEIDYILEDVSNSLEPKLTI